MALEITKSMTLTGRSMIDGVQAEGYSATINSDNPSDITFSSWQTDKGLYKDNRAQCRKDSADFEDAAYAIQDEMIAEKEATTETTVIE